MNRILILSYFLVIPFYLFSYPDRDVRGNYTENFLHLQGKADMRIGDRFFYYGQEIIIEFQITNYGNEPIRFYPKLGEAETYQFIITDENDAVVPLRDTFSLSKRQELSHYGAPDEYLLFHKEKFHHLPSKSPYKKLDPIQERRNRPVNMVGDEVKEVIIHKNESFTRKINLFDMYDLKPGKRYFVTGYFYPNYSEDRTVLLKTGNQVSFSVDSQRIQRNQNKFEEYESGEVSLSPEEVIYLFLGAELKQHWKNYFKYVHFPEYILSYTKYANLYVNSEGLERESVVDDFKKYLTESRHGKLKYYKVTDIEEINSTHARVTVVVERQENRLTRRYEYFYTLKKIDPMNKGFWKITNLVAKVRR
jgi:hypothetical protein